MLTDSLIASFQQRLESEQNDLLARLKVLDRKLGRNDEYDGAADLGDSSVNAFSKEEYLSERNHASDRLAEVQHALKRIAKGTYGYSEVSGKPIPIERLEAMPSATTLVDEKPFI